MCLCPGFTFCSSLSTSSESRKTIHKREYLYSYLRFRVFRRMQKLRYSFRYVLIFKEHFRSPREIRKYLWGMLSALRGVLRAFLADENMVAQVYSS